MNGICPSLEEASQPGNTIEIVKSERISRWLADKIEQNPNVSMVAIARHFSLVNASLLDVGCFDNLIELQPPTKEQRYSVIRDLVAPADFQSKEVKQNRRTHMLLVHTE